MIAYDHLKQKICIIVNMRTDKVMENYGEATAEIARIAGLIKSAPVPAIAGEPEQIDSPAM